MRENNQMHISPFALLAGKVARLGVNLAVRRNVAWQLDNGAFQQAQAHASDWSVWTVQVTLPNRSESHLLMIRVTDNAGRATFRSTYVPADTAPPVVVITQPADNPHTELWEGSVITLEVQGTAFDNLTALEFDDRTEVEVVEARLNDGEFAPVEKMGDGWSNWRITVDLNRRGNHLVAVRARDTAGNTSVPVNLKVEVEDIVDGDA